MPCPMGPGLGHSLGPSGPPGPAAAPLGPVPTEENFSPRAPSDDFPGRHPQRREACPAGCPGPSSTVGPAAGPELGLRFASYRYHGSQGGQGIPGHNGPGATTPEYYMPPPSPAPTNDRFVPPPPLSPPPTPSPDCYPSNPFPSPTTNTPTTTFIPPPPLSPSPTEKFPEKYSEKYNEKYEKFPEKYNEKYNEKYGEKYSEKYGEKFEKFSPKPDRFATGRLSYHSESSRYTPERNYPCYATTERYSSQNYHSNERYSVSERYLPPTAHTPVERYVPQPQEYYQYQTYERYPKWASNNNGDPYMRRDLGYHHHYRLPVPFQHQYHRIRYLSTPRKCCSLDYNLSKSSPGSTSSSSSSSHQQSELLSCYHVASPSMRTAPTQTKMATCKHMCSSPSVEYVGASGGRHVCATPPPGRSQGEICSGECCVRRNGNLHTATIWRPPPHHPSPQPNPSPTPVQQPLDPPPPDSHPHTLHQSQLTPHQPQMPTHQSQIVSQMPSHPSQMPQLQSHSVPQLQTIPTHQSTQVLPLQTHVVGTESSQQQKQSSQHAPPVQRAISLPAERYIQRESVQPIRQRLEYTQSERITNRERPKFARSGSRKEAVKNFIKKETANFFGVDEDTEVDQQLRWLDRRKRLASRTYGPLKDEYTPRSRYATISYSGPAHSGALHSGAPLGAPGSGVADSAPPPYHGDMPDVLPAGADVGDAVSNGTVERRHTVRRKDSVARMTWDGISYVVNTLTKHRPRPRSQVRQWSRSYPPEDQPSEVLEDDVFFERPTTPASPGVPEIGDAPDAPLDPRPPPQRYSSRSGAPGWKRDTITQRRDQQRPEVGGTRIWSAMLDTVLDNSDRRQYGMGWVGKMFGRSMRSSVAQEDRIKQQLDDLEDYRPLFTYWVTTVQVLVLAISLICYGFGPFGIDLYQRSGQVLVTSLSLQQVEYMEPANFWFGPRAADLIHLGAKFAPCMRVDDKIMKEIDKMREKERETACCIRNDDSGCVQSSQADCSKTISTWKKWSAGDSGPGGRISGSVCGLDPKFCDAPASVHPYEWPDDITKWPICRKTNSFTQRRGGSGGARPGTSVGTSARDKLAEHMVCEVIGHPCCIGIHGQCRITTREYCDFVRGHFHEEASLCAQVSCLDNVCGMVPFYFMETPDQFYRLWTSLFLHAGVLQLLVTVLIQHFLMRDLEKLTGPFRIGIIYIGSGVAGNLASAIFVPYRADVGPAGAQFGLLACLIVEVLNSWPMLKHPHYAMFKLISITFVLLLFGLLPWVDNYSHIFGFIFGFLLSYAFLPFVSFGPYERQRKVVLIWVCLTSAGILFVCLILLFYIIPVYDCEVCTYLNCLPLTKDFCATQNINFMKETPIV